MASLTIKSAVNYKMNYEADYSQIEFRGQTLPVHQFKRLVSDRKDLATPYRTPPEDKTNIRPPTDDIRVYNKDPLTDDTAIEYQDSDELKRNSIVIVKREQLEKRHNYMAERQREPKKILGLEGEYSEESGHLQLVAGRSDKIVTESIEGETNTTGAAGAGKNNGPRGPQFNARNPTGTVGRKLMPPPAGYNNRPVRPGVPRKTIIKPTGGAPLTTSTVPVIKSLDVAQLLAQPLLQSEKDEAREKLLHASQAAAAALTTSATTFAGTESPADNIAKPKSPRSPSAVIKTEDSGVIVASKSSPVLGAVKQEPGLAPVGSNAEPNKSAETPLKPLKNVKSPKSPPDADSSTQMAGKASSNVLSEQQLYQFAMPRAMPDGISPKDAAGVVTPKPPDSKDGVVESLKLTEYTDVDMEFPQLSERDKIKLVMSHMKMMYDHLAPITWTRYGMSYAKGRKSNFQQGPQRQLHHLQHSASDVGAGGQFGAYSTSTIKMATGIPRQQIQEVPNANYKGAMMLPGGGYGVRIADNEAYKRAAMQPAKQQQSNTADTVMTADSPADASNASLLPAGAAGGVETSVVPPGFTCDKCEGIMLGPRKQPYKVPCCGRIACYACLVPATSGAANDKHDADRVIVCPYGNCREEIQTSQLELQESLRTQIEWWVNHQNKRPSTTSAQTVAGSVASRSSATPQQQSAAASSQPPLQLVGPNGSIGSVAADGASSSSFVAGVNPSLLPASMAASAAAAVASSSGALPSNVLYNYSSNSNNMLGFHNNSAGNNMFDTGVSTASTYSGMATIATQQGNLMYNNYGQQSMNTTVNTTAYGSMRSSMGGGMHAMQPQHTGIYPQQQQQQQMLMSNRMQMGNNLGSNTMMRTNTMPMQQQMLNNNLRPNAVGTPLITAQQQQQQQQLQYNRSNIPGTMVSGQLPTAVAGDSRLSSQQQQMMNNTSGGFSSGAVRQGTMHVMQQQQQLQQRQNMLGTSMMPSGVAQQQYMPVQTGRVVGLQQSNTVLHRGMVMQQQQQQQQQQQPMQQAPATMNSQRLQQQSSGIITDDPLELFMNKMNDRDAERFTQRISVHERIGRTSSNRSSTSDLHHHTGSSSSVTGTAQASSATTSRRRSRSPLLVPSSSSSSSKQRVTMSSASLAQFDSDSLYDASALEAQQFLAANKTVLDASTAAAAAESSAASSNTSTPSAITIQARNRIRASFDGTPAASSTSVPRSKPPTPPEGTDGEERRTVSSVITANNDSSSPPVSGTGPLTDARSLLEAKRRKRQRIDGVTPTDADSSSSTAAAFSKRKEIRFGDGSSREMNVSTTPTKPQLVVAANPATLASVSRTVMPAANDGSSSSRRLQKSSAKHELAEEQTASTKQRHEKSSSSSKRSRDDSTNDDRHRHRRRGNDAVQADAALLDDDDDDNLRTSLASSVASSSATATNDSKRSTKHRSDSAERKERRRHRPPAESDTKDSKVSKKSRRDRDREDVDESGGSHRRRHRHRDRESDRHAEKDKKSHRRSHRSREEENTTGDSSNGSTIAATAAEYAAEGDSTLNTPPSAGESSRHQQEFDDDADIIAGGDYVRPSSKLHRSSPSKTSKHASKQYAAKNSTPSVSDGDEDELAFAAVSSNVRTPVSLDKRFSSSRLLVGALEQIRDQQDVGTRSDSRTSNRRTASRTREHSGRTTATDGRNSPVVQLEDAVRPKKSSKTDKSSKTSAASSDRAANDKKKVAAAPDEASTSSRHHRHHRDREERKRDAERTSSIAASSGKIAKKSSKVPSKSSTSTSSKSATQEAERSSTLKEKPSSSTSSRKLKVAADGAAKKSVRKPSSSSANVAASAAIAAAQQHDVLDLSTFPSVSKSSSVGDSQQYPVFTVSNTRSTTTMRIDDDVDVAERVPLRASTSAVTVGASKSSVSSLQDVSRFRQHRTKSAVVSSSSGLPPEGNVLIMASVSPTKDNTNNTSSLLDANRQQHHRRAIFGLNAAAEMNERADNNNDEVVLDVGYEEVAGLNDDVDDADGDTDVDSSTAERRRRHRNANLLMVARTDSGQSDQSTMTTGESAPAAAAAAGVGYAADEADDPMLDADDVFDNDDDMPSSSADVLEMVDRDRGKTSSGRSESKASLITTLRQHRRPAKEEKTEPVIDSRGRRTKRVHNVAMQPLAAAETLGSSKRRHDSRGRVKRNTASATSVPSSSEVDKSSKSDKHEQRSSRREKQRGSTSSNSNINKTAGAGTKSKRSAAATHASSSASHHRVLSMATLSVISNNNNDSDSSNSKSRTHSPHSAAYMAKNPLITITNRMAIDNQPAPSGGGGSSICSSIEMLASLKHNDNQQQQLRGVRRNIADRLGDKRGGGGGGGSTTIVNVADDNMGGPSSQSIIGAKSKHFINSYLLPGTGSGSSAVVVAPSGSNMPLTTGPPSTVVGLTTSKHRSLSSLTTTAANVRQQQHYAEHQQQQRVSVQQRVSATERIGHQSQQSHSNKSTPAKDYDALLLQQQQQHNAATGRAGSNSSNTTGRDGSVSSRSSPVDAAMLPPGADGQRRSAPYESAIMGTRSTEHRREMARAGEDILRRNLMRAIHDHIKPQHPQQQASGKHVSGDVEML